MGLFDKIKNVVKGFVGNDKDTGTNGAAENGNGVENAKTNREDARRFNPEGKSLEWFCSDDGLKAFKEYITPQNYFLEETIEKEKETKYGNYTLKTVVDIFHKDAKIPYVFFRNLIDNIKVQALEYVGPIELLIKVLSIQAKPFYIDEDGEPQTITACMSPEEIVSIEKNPVLSFVTNFNCFKLADDVQGSWNDKYGLWSEMITWLGAKCILDREILSENPWVFEKETYFNDLGTVRKSKSFYKKCIELSSDKDYFENLLNECP